MPAVTSKQVSLECRVEARAGTSVVLGLQLSVSFMWKSLVAGAGCPFPCCSALPCKRAGLGLRRGLSRCVRDCFRAQGTLA